MRLIRFGQDDNCVVLDADDIAWVQVGTDEDGEPQTVSVTLKCGQQLCIYREHDLDLFNELLDWVLDRSTVDEDDPPKITSEYGVNQLTEVQKAYLAAFVDADGCITIGKRQNRVQDKAPRYYLEVKICQCNGPFIKALEEEVGAGRAYSRPRETGKTMHRLQIRDAQAYDFLCAIYPYLRIKKPQADVAFEFRRTFEIRYGKRGVPEHISKKRKWCREELQRLKREIGEDSWYVQ